MENLYKLFFIKTMLLQTMVFAMEQQYNGNNKSEESIERIDSQFVAELNNEKIDWEKIKLLIAQGAYPNLSDNRGFTALIKALGERKIDMVEFLLNNGADIDQRISKFKNFRPTPLENLYKEILAVIVFYTISSGRISEILQNYKSLRLINTRFNKILTSDDYSIQKIKNLIAQVKKLKQNFHANFDENIFEKDPNGYTVLTWAIENNCLELVKFLIDLKDKDGKTALILAAELGDYDMVTVLIYNGANVSIANNKGVSALMAAAFRGYKDIVDLLILNGADVEQRYINGSTILMAASQEGYTEIVKILISKGSKVNIQNDNKMTSLIVAAKNKHKDIVFLPLLMQVYMLTHKMTMDILL